MTDFVADNGPRLTDKSPSWLRSLIKRGSLTPHQFQSACAYLRCTQRLFTRYKVYARYIEDIETALRYNGLLVLVNITHSLCEIGFGPEVPYKERREKLAWTEVQDDNALTAEETERLEASVRYLEGLQREKRANEWVYRVELALTDCVERGWYPYFGTYTVDPKQLPEGCLNREDLFRKTPAWDRFVKKVKTCVAYACGHGGTPGRWPRGETFFKYFAVLEFGETGEHPHIHVIWMCKNVPSAWKEDPNEGYSPAIKQDVPHFSALWKWGVVKRTSPIFVNGGPFQKMGWKVPVGRKVSDGRGVAIYMSKYMTKQKENGKDWRCRVKATKNLGVNLLRSKLQEMPTRVLFTLSCRPVEFEMAIRLQSLTNCPLGLLRRESRVVLLKRLLRSRRSRAAKLIARWTTRAHASFYKVLVMTAKNGVSIRKLDSSAIYKMTSVITPGIYRVTGRYKRARACDPFSDDRLAEVDMCLWSAFGDAGICSEAFPYYNPRC